MKQASGASVCISVKWGRGWEPPELRDRLGEEAGTHPHKELYPRTSLVVQRLRIRLPTQGTQV